MNRVSFQIATICVRPRKWFDHFADLGNMAWPQNEYVDPIKLLSFGGYSEIF